MRIMRDNKYIKYSYYCEGDCDEKLLHSIKIIFFKIKGSYL